MRINKCDNCNRMIKARRGLSLYCGYSGEIELCHKCADPITLLITDKGLLNPDIVAKLTEEDPLVKMQKKLKARLRT